MFIIKKDVKQINAQTNDSKTSFSKDKVYVIDYIKYKSHFNSKQFLIYFIFSLFYTNKPAINLGPDRSRN